MIPRRHRFADAFAHIGLIGAAAGFVWRGVDLRGAYPWWVLAAAVVVLVPLFGMLYSRWTEARSTRAWLRTGAAGAVDVDNAPRSVRAAGSRWRGLLLFALAVTAVLWWWYSYVSGSQGMAAEAQSFTAVGATTALVGLALGIPVPAGSPAPSSAAGRRTALAGGAVLGAAVLALTVVLTTAAAVDSATAPNGSEGAPARVPSAVEEVGWTWAAPDGGEVVRTLPVRGGIVVRTGDGVYALDGATGEERWHYRRPNTSLVSLVPSPDGTAVAARFESKGRSDSHGPPSEVHYVVLGADSGERLAADSGRVGEDGQWVLPDLGLGSDPFARGVTADGIVTAENESVSVRGFDGAERWRWWLPDDCAFRYTDRPQGDAAWNRDTVAVALACDAGDEPREGLRRSRLTVAAFDTADGTERWRLEEEQVIDAYTPLDLDLSDDGSRFALTVEGMADRPDGAVLLFDSGSGAATTVSEGPLVPGPLRPRLPTEHFDADRAFSSADARTWSGEDRLDFALVPYDGGEPVRASASGWCPAGSGVPLMEDPPSGVPLEDSVVAACSLPGNEVSVAVLPWGASGPPEVVIDIGLSGSDGLHAVSPLTPAPGVVAVVGPRKVYGLV